MKHTLSIALVVVLLSPALSVSAQTTGPSNNSGTVLDTVCAKPVVEIREDSLKAAYNAHASKINTIMDARKSALVDALSKPTSKERSAARKAARQTAKTAVKAANTELRTKRTEIWNTYKTQMTKCAGGPAEARNDKGSISANPTDL